MQIRFNIRGNRYLGLFKSSRRNRSLDVHHRVEVEARFNQQNAPKFFYSIRFIHFLTLVALFNVAGETLIVSTVSRDEIFGKFGYSGPTRKASTNKSPHKRRQI